MSSLETKNCILKELPSKELKLKRHKDMRDSPNLPPVRLRLRNRTSPLCNEINVEKCLSDRSVCSSPDSFSQEKFPVFVNLYKSVNFVPSPILMSEHCEPFQLTSKFEVDEHSDQPLDMSKKSRQESFLSCDKDNFQCSQQQFRPSVITCASALLQTHCNLSELGHHMCSANVSDCNQDKIKQNTFGKCINMSDEDNKTKKSGHRHEVVSGSCDPVIDEHFRRSLGKDYQQIFSKSTGNNVSITVDEHFAKALGDTWHQIQQSNSPSDDTLSTTHSPNSLRSSSSSHIMPQPPEILS